MPLHNGLTRIPNRTRRRIYQLIDQGVTYRNIAIRCRCHHNSVYNLQRLRRRLRDEGKQLVLDESEDTRRRCGGCGNFVDMPCLACSARRAERPEPRGRSKAWR